MEIRLPIKKRNLKYRFGEDEQVFLDHLHTEYLFYKIW